MDDLEHSELDLELGIGTWNLEWRFRCLGGYHVLLGRLSGDPNAGKYIALMIETLLKAAQEKRIPGKGITRTLFPTSI